MQNLAETSWVDGHFTPSKDTDISMLNHSLHYSGSVFEGIRSYQGKVFRLRAHMERLIKSAELIGLECKYSVIELCNACEELLKINKLKDTYIRPVIFRHSPNLQMHSNDLTSITAIFITESAPIVNNNTNLTISRWRKSHPLSLPPQSKSSSHYASCIAALQEAKANGYDDAIMLDLDGYVAECTVTNIFFATGNKIVTPVADNCLNGITRQEIIKLALQIGMNVTETKLLPEEIVNYDCCFKTGTSAEIKGVTSIDINGKTHKFTNQTPTLMLQKMFRQLVLS